MRYDIFEEGSEDARAAGTFDLVQGYARNEPFVIKELQCITYQRRPEFAEQERMLAPSPEGFFEDTPENAVVLFCHAFRGSGFDVGKLKEVPLDLKAGIIEQFYSRARSVEDYCSEVWRRHNSAQEAVA